MVSIEAGEAALAIGKVSFGGVLKEVCLAYVPEVQVGDYVIVHAGFALNRLDEDEAMEVFDLLDQVTGSAATDMGGPAGAAGAGADRPPASGILAGNGVR